jgi:hypothetical protein
LLRRQALKRSIGLKATTGLKTSRVDSPVPAVASCAYCGNSFKPRKTHLGITRFCSRTCSGAARTTRNGRKCPVCHQLFDAQKSTQKACSSSCANELKAQAKKGARNPMKAQASRAKLRTTLATKTVTREVGLPPRRTHCARPGCGNALRPEQEFYCSPTCHYAHRGGEHHRMHGGGFQRADWDIIPLGLCVCGCGRLGQHRHHVVFKQHVVRYAGDPWDPANMAFAHISCHAQLHAKPWLPIVRLPEPSLRFAYRLMGLPATDYLQRRYVGPDPRLAFLERIVKQGKI